MTLSAPPRPPAVGDPADRRELEALIEEARQRARRRRRMYVAAATLVALVGVALFTVLARGGSSEYASPAPSERSLIAAVGDSKITFVRGPCCRPGRLVPFVINADGSGERRLALQRDVVGFDWSRDGRRIAVMAAHKGNVDLFVTNADGSAPRRLTRQRGAAGDPRWSADGRRIYFVRWTIRKAWSTARIKKFSLYVVNADGSGLRRLTRSIRFDSGIEWSPDARKIAFYRLQGWGSFDNADIYVMDVDGGGVRNLTRSPENEQARGWSPDGRRLAFTRTRDWSSGPSDIYVVNADGSGLRRLTGNAEGGSAVQWSSDGRTIAFVSVRHGRPEISLMNADGSGVRTLVRDAAKGSSVSWSAGGRMVAFTSDRDGNSEIYIVNSDGSRLRRLTHNPAWDAFPIWLPG